MNSPGGGLHSDLSCLPLIHAPQTPDIKKEEFRKYLEKAGVVDALTRVLVGLYEEPERPASAVDYVKRYMGAASGVDVEALRAENERLRAEVSSLQHQLSEAQRALANR